jgi:hypothetical protein
MEKLQLESTGFWTTPSGLFAAEIIHTSAKYLNDQGYEISYFEFRVSAMSDVVRVEWPTVSGMGIFEADVVRGMVTRGWARSINADKADEYNGLVDKWLEANKEVSEKEDEAKVEVKPAPVVKDAPVVEVALEPTPEPEYIAPSEPAHSGRFKTKNKPVSEDKSS